LRIKEQGMHLTLQEHDDDDDEGTYSFSLRVTELLSDGC